MVYLFNGITLSNEKEEISGTCNNMESISKYYAKQKKLDQKKKKKDYTLYDSVYVKLQRKQSVRDRKQVTGC